MVYKWKNVNYHFIYILVENIKDPIIRFLLTDNSIEITIYMQQQGSEYFA